MWNDLSRCSRLQLCLVDWKCLHIKLTNETSIKNQFLNSSSELCVIFSMNIILSICRPQDFNKCTEMNLDICLKYKIKSKEIGGSNSSIITQFFLVIYAVLKWKLNLWFKNVSRSWRVDFHLTFFALEKCHILRIEKSHKQ